MAATERPIIEKYRAVRTPIVSGSPAKQIDQQSGPQLEVTLAHRAAASHWPDQILQLRSVRKIIVPGSEGEGRLSWLRRKSAAGLALLTTGLSSVAAPTPKPVTSVAPHLLAAVAAAGDGGTPQAQSSSGNPSSNGNKHHKSTEMPQSKIRNR